MPSNPKYNRISAELGKQVSEIINYGLSDPRTKGGMISVTRSIVTPDLKYAKVYVSFLGFADAKEAFAGVKSAAGYIRNELKVKMNIRNIPELTFLPDDSIEYGIKLSKLIDDVNSEGKNDK